MEEHLDISIEPPILKLFICLFTLFFYSSLYFFSWEGSTVGGGLNALQRTEGFQVSREGERESARDVNNRSERGRESGEGQNEGGLKRWEMERKRYKEGIKRTERQIGKEPGSEKDDRGRIEFSWRDTVTKNTDNSHACIRLSIHLFLLPSSRVFPASSVVRSRCIRQRFIFY